MKSKNVEKTCCKVNLKNLWMRVNAKYSET
jgi:hypothetical protein